MIKRPLLLALASMGLACLTTPLVAQISWGSTNTRYAHQIAKHKVSEPSSPTKLQLEGWRGESLNAQLVVQNKEHDESLYRIRLGKLVNSKRKALRLQKLELGYVDEVLADTFSNCGLHDLEKHGRFKQADRLVLKPQFLLPRGEQRGVWLSLEPSRDSEAGVYEGSVEILRDGKLAKRLPISIKVLDHTLPPAKDWGFHLDFWQNPYAIARWYETKLWSDEHLNAMRPYMQRLAQSGQKVITATLIDRPWNGQTQDAYGSMIEWKKAKDGTWSYDYSVFDRWVSFMMDCGVDKEITCFSMIPWQLSFQYYDAATDSLKHWESKPGEELYSERWGHFLRDFSKHLRSKGWVNKTTIAMDERSLEQMQAAIALIKKNAPDIKISMAGNYHKEIEADLVDYCVDYMSPEQYTPEVLARRKKEGKISTYYTCCSSAILNTFTFSPLGEAELIPWFALKKGYDGYLRWAYNSWTLDPNYDSRFRAWSSGDTYIVYPNNYPSLRWLKLHEGIQQFEKYKMLLKKAQDRKDSAKVQKLETLLNGVDLGRINEPGVMVDELQTALNKF